MLKNNCSLLTLTHTKEKMQKNGSRVDPKYKMVTTTGANNKYMETYIHADNVI